MNVAKILLLAAVILGSAAAAQAQRNWTWQWDERFRYTTDEKFRANELTFDLFASYGRGHGHFNDFFDQTLEHGTWGGGVGANYFFTKYLGVGADVFMHANGNEFIDHTSLGVIGRFPIERISLAPYAFGGAGRNFDPIDEWTAHAGIGLEWRLNPHTGIFADGRYVWPDKSGDFSLLRAGLRFAF